MVCMWDKGSEVGHMSGDAGVLPKCKAIHS